MLKPDCEFAKSCKAHFELNSGNTKIEELIGQLQTLVETFAGNSVEGNHRIDDVSSRIASANGVEEIKLVLKDAVQLLVEQKKSNSEAQGELLKLANELKEENEKLQTDKLTGLYNRHVFDKSIARLIREYQEKGKKFSLAVLDIDKFKSINDTHGHAVGDLVLKYFAEFLLKYFSNTEVFRFGGEEFVVLSQALGAEVKGRLDGVLGDLNKTRVLYKKETRIPLTFSGGVSEVEENDDEKLIFERADALVYKAKHSGRNQIHI